MNIAVILAGGVGNRVGATNDCGEHIPKQFVEVLGNPVLAYTVDVFQKHPEIEAIEIVCLESYIDYIYDMKNKYNFTKVKWVTAGGDTFQKSVLNGVIYLEDKVKNDDIILVHFAASPFVEDYIISDAIKVCKEKGNAISATDYYLLCGRKINIKSVDEPDNCSVEYINRDSIACMSTPHAFQYSFINSLYKEAIQSGAIDRVEPHTTTLMYELGKTIYFSKGSQTNIKITRREDLDLFEGYLLMKQKRTGKWFDSN